MEGGGGMRREEDVGGVMMGFRGGAGRGGAGWRGGYEGEEMGMKRVGQSMKWGG